MSPNGQLAAEPIQLDKLDYEIVEQLSRDPELTNRVLAERLRVAESTCAYRRRRLREHGILGRVRLDIDYARLGYGLQAVITVYINSHSREIVESFLRAMVEAPHVVNVTHLTGRSDFMITVAVQDAHALQHFILDHVTVHRAVRGTETQIIFDSRRGTWIPEHT